MEETGSTDYFTLEQIMQEKREVEKDLETLSFLKKLQSYESIYNEKIQLEYVLPVNGVTTNYTIGLGDGLGKNVLSLIEDSILKRWELLSAIEENLKAYRLKTFNVTGIETSSNEHKSSINKKEIE